MPPFKQGVDAVSCADYRCISLYSVCSGPAVEALLPDECAKPGLDHRQEAIIDSFGLKPLRMTEIDAFGRKSLKNA